MKDYLLTYLVIYVFLLILTVLTYTYLLYPYLLTYACEASYLL